MDDAAQLYDDLSKFLASQKPRKTKKSKPEAPDYKVRELDARLAKKEADAHIAGVQQYYKLRGSWSTFLKWLLGISIAIQAIILTVVGTVWIYAPERMPTDVAERIIFLVIGENFLQIVGMCWLVVKFLFPSKTDGHQHHPHQSN